MKDTLKIKIVKADDMEEGFAAYRIGSVKDKNPIILLNVFATLAVSETEDITAKEIIIESLMHEFGHVLEEYVGKEFDEEFIEKAVMSYRDKYGSK